MCASDMLINLHHKDKKADGNFLEEGYRRGAIGLGCRTPSTLKPSFVYFLLHNPILRPLSSLTTSFGPSCTRRRRRINQNTPYPTRKFLVDNFLPVSFLVAIVIALAWPYPGQKVMDVKILGHIFLFQELAMILVFFISGFTLKAGDALAALRRGRGVAWGFLSILGITPLLGFALRAVPLIPEEFSTAMAIMAAVPTTLGIGLALVVSSDGDDAVAVLLTVGTNLLGESVFCSPFFFPLFFGSFHKAIKALTFVGSKKKKKKKRMCYHSPLVESLRCRCAPLGRAQGPSGPRRRRPR